MLTKAAFIWLKYIKCTDENSNIMEKYYNLKELFSIWI